MPKAKSVNAITFKRKDGKTFKKYFKTSTTMKRAMTAWKNAGGKLSTTKKTKK